MKRVTMLSILLITGYTLFGQLSILPSGLGKSESLMVNQIKTNVCSFSISNSRQIQLVKKIDSGTKILRIYDRVFIVPEKYNYESNIISFLSTSSDDFRLLMFNPKPSNRIEVLGMAQLIPDFDSCYSVSPSRTEIAEKIKYFIPFMEKIDLEVSTLFMVYGGDLSKRESELCLLSKDKVYVIRNGEIIPFNEYYKKKFSLKKFKWHFREIEIK